MARRSTRAERALVELARRAAQSNLLAFMRWCWWEPNPFRIGTHTAAITNRLTKAVADWREGKSTHLMIAVPFRHGKSDMVSRALPAWFLGCCADREPSIVMSGYGADLVADFSRKAKEIVSSDTYRDLFPGVEVGRGASRADRWAIRGSAGQVTAAGLGGALTGRGGHLIICDDYCRSRAEAMSEAYRNSTWAAFRNNLMTRKNSPASIVIVCATPWHVDDVRGRILAEMESNPDFPRFEQLTFPAQIPGQYDYLFPELHSEEWYRHARAMLGKTQAAALLDCNPEVEGGNRFKVDGVRYYDSMDGWPQGREHRAWDLASSSKERDKDDPDWTWGIKGQVTTERLGNLAIHDIWISSMVATQMEATARNQLIVSIAVADGRGVHQHVEAFGAYKDAYTQLRDVLRGVSIVKPSRLPGDKAAKAAPMEPVFESCRVHVYVPGCGGHVDMWRSQFASFPAGKHDDAVDATVVLYHAARGGNGSKFII